MVCSVAAAGPRPGAQQDPVCLLIKQPSGEVATADLHRSADLGRRVLDPTTD
jgi:hypothetical protein